MAGTWGGLTDEGVEIGGKKISSEEETFSDLSVLILYNNFLVGEFCLVHTNAAQQPDLIYRGGLACPHTADHAKFWLVVPECTACTPTLCV